MRVVCFFAVGVTICGSALSSRVLAQSSPPTADARPTAAAAAAPAVAEQADRLLRQMGAYIGSAGQFTFHADITFDHILPSGQKLQFSAAEDVALQRPKRLYVEWSGDLGDRQFWYDGTSITLDGPATPFYATEAAPPDIDGMLEKLVPQVGFAPPLADFLYRDPYKSGGYYSGLGLGAGFAIGATMAALPAVAIALSVAGTPYWYGNGVYYASQAGLRRHVLTAILQRQ